jgi:hypothetical protein
LAEGQLKRPLAARSGKGVLSPTGNRKIKKRFFSQKTTSLPHTTDKHAFQLCQLFNRGRPCLFDGLVYKLI